MRYIIETRQVELDTSNPENIVSAPAGTLFYRDGYNTFYLINGSNYSRIEVSKKSMALAYVTQPWYQAITDSQIIYKYQKEIWRKVSGDGNTGWVYSSNQSPTTIDPSPTPTSTVTPTISVSVSLTPTTTPTLTTTPSITPTNTETPVVTVTPTITETPVVTVTPTISDTPTPTPTLSSIMAMCPQILTQPIDTNVNIPESGILGIEIDTLTYPDATFQWQNNETNLSDGDFSGAVFGAQSSQIEFDTSVMSPALLTLRCVVSNPDCSDVISDSVTLAIAPEIVPPEGVFSVNYDYGSTLNKVPSGGEMALGDIPIPCQTFHNVIPLIPGNLSKLIFITLNNDTFSDIYFINTTIDTEDSSITLYESPEDYFGGEPLPSDDYDSGLTLRYEINPTTVKSGEYTSADIVMEYSDEDGGDVIGSFSFTLSFLPYNPVPYMLLQTYRYNTPQEAIDDALVLVSSDFFVDRNKWDSATTNYSLDSFSHNENSGIISIDYSYSIDSTWSGENAIAPQFASSMYLPVGTVTLKFTASMSGTSRATTVGASYASQCGLSLQPGFDVWPNGASTSSLSSEIKFEGTASVISAGHYHLQIVCTLANANFSIADDVTSLNVTVEHSSSPLTLDPIRAHVINSTTSSFEFIDPINP